MLREKITILSGGSAIKDIMFELLKYSVDITRVVPSTDNGASSKELRDVFGILSVGDIRQSLAISIPHTQSNKQLVKFINWRFAIEDTSIDELKKLVEDKQSLLYQISSTLSIQEKLIEYLEIFLQQPQSINLNLNNGSIGNFLLVGAYLKYQKNWNRAIAQLENIFGCKAKVLPIYLNNSYHLKANFYNGTIIYGESEITSFRRDEKQNIESLQICQLDDKKFTDILPIVNIKVINSIDESDTIVFSPGSLFTSILPHLVNQEVLLSLSHNQKAKKVFLINLVQDSETIGYTAFDIIQKVESIANKRGFKIEELITDIIINNNHSQISFFNSQKERKCYIQKGELEIYRQRGISIIIRDLEDPWKRGEFDPQEVVKILLSL